MLVRIHDLSLGGCLIEAPFNVEIGRRITLHLDLPGEGRLVVQAEIVRLRANYGFAVKFVDVDKDIRGRLERALERLLAVSPGEDWTLDGGLNGV
ncbi:MAG TPA: PilZ domain-containing protein [Vicinamibacterales bacterium]|nr:PilZ domain-containing protein [Vicinamibacterales bacterium]